MAILERYAQMQAFFDELEDLEKYETERDELTSSDISALEDTEGLMEDIAARTTNKRIESLANKNVAMTQKILALVSPEYCKVRGIESACREGR